MGSIPAGNSHFEQQWIENHCCFFMKKWHFWWENCQLNTAEIISGHRRKFTAEKNGYRKVPVIIRVLKDDDAVVSMVDSNSQREMISPSEKDRYYYTDYNGLIGKDRFIASYLFEYIILFRGVCWKFCCFTSKWF